MTQWIFLFPLFILPSLCVIPNFNRQFQHLQRQKQPQGYRYRLDNECYPALQDQLVTVPPEFQPLVFDFIALNISDLRMFPSTCRRPAIWLLCSLAFPSAQQTPDDTQGVCVVGEDECEYVSDQCQGQLDCSGLEGFFTKGDEGGLCPRVEESLDIPVEVTTCLTGDQDTTYCCFDPFVLADGTRECVVECPASTWNNKTNEIVSYVVFGLMWLSVFVLLVGFIPLMFLEGSLDYPKAFVPMGLVTVTMWTFTKMWGVFVGIDEFVCQGEEDGVAATLSFFYSGTCSAQLFFLNFFSSLISTIMVVVASLFLIMVSDPTSRLVSSLKPLFYLFLIVPPLIISGVVTLLFELEVEDKADMVFLSVGNSCQLQLYTSFGLAQMIYYTVFFSLMYILTFLGIVKVLCRSWHLFRVHIRPVIFLAIMIYITSLLLVIFYHVFPDEQNTPEEYEEGLTCVATHAQDVNYPCKYEFMDNFALYSALEISAALAPTVGGLTLFWNEVIFIWWMNLITHQEIGRSIASMKSTGSLGSGSQEEGPADLPERGSSRLLRAQQQLSKK